MCRRVATVATFVLGAARCVRSICTVLYFLQVRESKPGLGRNRGSSTRATQSHPVSQLQLALVPFFPVQPAAIGGHALNSSTPCLPCRCKSAIAHPMNTWLASSETRAALY
jgi:hypothetical protein